MGIISKGILGPFSGTVGTVVGSSWKGIDYMRSLPRKSDKAPSPAQRDHRIKFSLIGSFLRTMTPLLQVSFKDKGKNMSGVNSAFSYNIKNAVTGAYPDFEIDYNMALVSRGDLPNATTPQAVVAAGNTINWTWANNSGAGKALGTDKAILVAYCKVLNQCIFDIVGERGDGAATRILNLEGFIADLEKCLERYRFELQTNTQIRHNALAWYEKYNIIKLAF